MRVVILAGGKGTRLWPLSLENLPKQFLKLGDNHSLLQKSVLRFSLFPITIVTHQKYLQLVERDLKEIGQEKNCEILLEPESKNTAPAVTLALLHLANSELYDPKEKILVVPSDHYFSSDSFFKEKISRLSHELFQNTILLFGVSPTMPHTGYGYIESGEKEKEFTKVKRFIEKPSLQKAKEYILSGNHLWNVGMALFSSETFWHQLRVYNSEIFDYASRGIDSFIENYDKLPCLSLDYALLERTKDCYVYPLHMGWSDVGSWDNLYEVMEKDDSNNVKKGNVVTLDTKNSFILADKKLITVLGMRDLIVVDTKDAVFIAKKGASQRVKELFQKMRDLSKEEKPKTNKRPLPGYIE